MTLDANKPTDQVLGSELPTYIREDRAEINSITGAGGVGNTALTVAAGATSLSIGTDLGDEGIEVVEVTGAGVATLVTILGGTEGQVKKLIFQDANVRLTDGAKAGGAFYLNQLPALSTFFPQQDDVIELVNIGGDGAAVYGYWKELYRTLSIK